VWLHLLIALAAAYYGWATVPEPRAATESVSEI
jgi:hypothetical protein